MNPTADEGAKRVLIVQPSLQPPGGGNAVAAWVVQALRDDYRVSLLCTKPVECDAVNRFFGTDLQPGDFEVHRFDSLLVRVLGALPVPLTLLKVCLLIRHARRHLRSHDYDVVISTFNETDFGRPGIQYVHYPWDYEPRPDADLRWYHGLAPVLWAYRRSCRAISGVRPRGIRANLTLTNSDYVAARMRARYGVEPETLYPPVPGEFPDVAWEDREDGFVCIGRISPEKELEKVIDIVSAVRARGHEVKLHLVGTDDDPAYTRWIAEKIAGLGAWAHLHDDLARDELIALLVRNRYGIHGMVGEHFGIAVAELVRAGCIPFAPEEGGPAESVGRRPELLYASLEDAADKIDRVLADEATQRALHLAMLARRDLFSAERFVARWRALVADRLA